MGMMQWILVVILALCGYLALLKYVYDHAANRNAFPILAILLLLVYGGVFAGVVMTLSRLGSTEYMFVGILMLAACVTLFVMVYYLLRNFQEIRKSWLAVFILYLLAVGYLTIFNRSEGRSTDVLTGFASFQRAIETRSLAPLNHFMLNVVMFLPLGFLFPMLQPERLDKLLLVTPISAMLSVAIESIQLTLRLGQCDLEDIVANTLGGVLGLLVYRLYIRLFHPDGVMDEEEEEE